MLKAEIKIIEWVNRHIVHIAFLFVIFVAGMTRLAGRNYVGIDYHFSLYDIAGNCNSYLYRSFVDFIMARWTDYAIQILKFLAYLGDFGVALLALFLLKEKRHVLTMQQAFFAATACLLSPVALIYSVSGMKMDSVCMCFLLLGLLLYRNDRVLPAVLVMTLAAFIVPSYWPVVTAVCICLALHQIRQKGFGKSVVVCLILFLGLLILSVVLENRDVARGYYWGKFLVTDPGTGAGYASFRPWLFGMCRVYGYCVAMFTLLFSFRCRKLRIPALVLQLAVLMLVGWYQTKHLIV